MIRILLADDQAIFRAGTARVLDADVNVSVMGQCDAPAALLDQVAGSRDCVVIVAQSLGVDTDKLLAAAAAVNTRVVLLTETGAEPHAALVRRLDGLLNRQASAADLLACVRRVGNGERAVAATVTTAVDTVAQRMLTVLTPRELQIVGFVVQGWKNRQIAEELGTKEQVVKNYLRSIYDKTGSSDRLELALFTLHHRPLAEAAARACETLQASTA
ncbi:response regulator containing a CheY-like receiver domain and an HTH DNA-binding domain [Terriglobus roseus DSM 18391]|uniref:Response regulator containing a CheY-like receiver domain and an HTH DNA-binding domain n=1 Tax=Terriglobus roseus (strain DSM 18391 / NRRL B-41598 / KBS 63) TaxID=926566 RepID=I3ZK36_TERRK|nr:response regulator transcription factor [Terriglobus roseus]AFL89604.1 response regulator containing a CheY-like receiver domain and an HTH DNA-binding domain [Terriglobus roseus DSM 18391]